MDFILMQNAFWMWRPEASKNIWLIEAADCVPITGILDLHKQQLQRAPVYAVGQAQQRVLNFGKSDKRSP
ncbi:UNVERIFIED_ORG: hypothetical protein ABIC62_006708 [Burkholderia sp. 1595]|uniref:Uncharacterized protein n=1 Tax=Paraburkholderia terricola TaxID=169427 RepID=A0ABU1M324_9BURK|nr:hypothetical protein [Paraburkholderia terricola]MDR6413269.1 hypothetical protein [Paraburkholderia terricola]